MNNDSENVASRKVQTKFEQFKWTLQNFEPQKKKLFFMNKINKLTLIFLSKLQLFLINFLPFIISTSIDHEIQVLNSVKFDHNSKLGITQSSVLNNWFIETLFASFALFPGSQTGSENYQTNLIYFIVVIELKPNSL